MRCQDFERELSAPTGLVDARSMYRHRGDCPRCAALAARADAFDLLWAATTPDAPPSGEFERLWAAVEGSSGIDMPASRRPRRGWLALPGLAAAAALAFALIPKEPAPRTGPIARSAEIACIDVEPGRVLKIHLLAGGAVEVAHRPADESSTDFELSNKATMLSSVEP